MSALSRLRGRSHRTPRLWNGGRPPCLPLPTAPDFGRGNLIPTHSRITDEFGVPGELYG
jgi:hypothetical protein